MSFQSSVNAVVGTAAAANKVQDIAPKPQEKSQASLSGISSARAFQKSNQGIIEEYTKKQANLQRTKGALSKMGRWGDKQESQLKFYGEQIKRCQSVDMVVTGRINKMMDELAKEGSKENGEQKQ